MSKLPNNMRTGRPFSVTTYTPPETFQVTMLILNGILRRNGYKDATVYCSHNSDNMFYKWINSGMLFNIYSKYGVGKKLEPLLRELFSTRKLDPEKNKDNVFFKEIIKLVPEASNVIRMKDMKKEHNWIHKYAWERVWHDDEIFNERLYRLFSLLMTKVDPKFPYEIRCNCDFCVEFRKYKGTDEEVANAINQCLRNLYK